MSEPFNNFNKWSFRHSTAEDESRIWQIILQAKEQLRLAGSTQWQDGYPTPSIISEDTNAEKGFVLTENKKIIAYGAISFYEEAYDHLEGQWLYDAPYIVVHRLAVADEMKHKGVAYYFFSCVEQYAMSKEIKSFRVDTNYDNQFMLKILKKNGFEYCGEVKYRQGSLRKAFEKLMTSNTLK